MVNNRGFLKTLEAVIAIVIFLIFMVSALVFNQPPKDTSVPNDIKAIQETTFSKIETDLTLRDCAVTEQNACIQDAILPLIPETLSYQFEICTNEPGNCPMEFVPPEGKVIYSDSRIIQHEGNSAIIRLFLWRNLQE